MKQKYQVELNEKRDKLSIKEYAALDKEIFSFLCEESYDVDRLKSAISKGRDEVIAALRTPNMYPIGSLAENMADSVIELCASKESSSVEIVFDDKRVLIEEEEKVEALTDLEEDDEGPSESD